MSVQFNFYYGWLELYLEKKMATHSSVLAGRIPGMEEPGGLLSVGSHGVRHDWSDFAARLYSLAILLCSYPCIILYFTLPSKQVFELKNKSKQIKTKWIACVCWTSNKPNPISKKNWRTSLVVQWIRICLPMQGTWVRSLVWEDSICHRATKSMHHSERRETTPDGKLAHHSRE